MELIKITTNGQITVPSEFRKQCHCKTGDYLQVEISGNSLTLKPAQVIDPSQSWFWTKEWQEKEKEADKEKALDDAKKAKGADLTEDEKNEVNELSNLKFEFENQPKLNLQNLDVKTNALADRGGFQGGVVATNVDRINTQIAAYAKRQADLLAQIKDQVSKMKEY